MAKSGAAFDRLRRNHYTASMADTSLLFAPKIAPASKQLAS
jgi:hypothetical protein